MNDAEARPLVIAVHGAALNRMTWLPLSRELSVPWELSCDDLPGHGSRQDEPFRFEVAVGEVVRRVASAGSRRVVVAGDSLGGYIALAAAAQLGTRVARVVAGGCTWSMTGVWGHLARATDWPAALLENVAGAERCDAWLASIVRVVSIRPSDAQAIIAAGIRTRARSESLAELRRFDLTTVAGAIRSPVVFVNGARDWPTRLGESAVLAVAPRARLAVIPDVGHGVAYFAPTAFAREICAPDHLLAQR